MLSDPDFYLGVLIAVFLFGAVSFIALLWVAAPYGRHAGGRSIGPAFSTRATWVIMESPAVFGFLVFFALGPHASGFVPLVLLAIWMSHYVQRTLIYPFRMRVREGDTTPLYIGLMAFVFNVANAYLNGSWISGVMGRQYEMSWLYDPRFLIGVALFALGYAINRWADAVLRKLRKPGESGYKIPGGGLYEKISCPNYFGEIVEWCGWAIATWSPAGLCFAAFTACNLIPRAVSHHRWYRDKFPDYPKERKAVLPYIW